MKFNWLLDQEKRNFCLDKLQVCGFLPCFDRLITHLRKMYLQVFATYTNQVLNAKYISRLAKAKRTGSLLRLLFVFEVLVCLGSPWASVLGYEPSVFHSFRMEVTFSSKAFHWLVPFIWLLIGELLAANGFREREKHICFCMVWLHFSSCQNSRLAVISPQLVLVRVQNCYTIFKSRL